MCGSCSYRKGWIGLVDKERMAVVDVIVVAVVDGTVAVAVAVGIVVDLVSADAVGIVAVAVGIVVVDAVVDGMVVQTHCSSSEKHY